MIPPDLSDRERWVRLGTGRFSKAADRLDASSFDQAVPLPGWTARHLVAHVAYNAVALGRLVDWAATGVETPMYSSPEARNAEIAQGAQLPVEVLRELLEQTAVDLFERWDALSEDRWTSQVRTAQGRMVPVAETLWMRAREVWVHAVDLGGLEVTDFPDTLIDALTTDVVGLWDRKGQGPSLVLRADDVGREYRVLADADAAGPIRVSGPAADLLRWIIGRGRSAAVATEQDDQSIPELGRWL